MLKYIKNKRVTVITNNGKAIFMDHDPMVSICLSGGELRIPKESMVGDFALNNLNKVSATKAFLGCSGFSVASGMTTAILQEVAINEVMITRCIGETFILADHTKIGTNHSFITESAISTRNLSTCEDLRTDWGGAERPGLLRCGRSERTWGEPGVKVR